MIKRRTFVKALGAAGVGLLGHARTGFAAEPPPETTRLRLVRTTGSVCQAPQYIAEELFRSEGFTEVTYVRKDGPHAIAETLASGEADVNMHFSGPLIVHIDAGKPLVILGGVHVGCYELFGTDRVRSIRDLKGRTIAIGPFGGPHHVFLSSILAHIGLDPRKDVTWVTRPFEESKLLLAEGKIDAYLGFPPDPQELRAKKVGHVMLNSSLDRPWSQYFCCMLAGNRDFVRKHPVATKRALRAVLKATAACATEPDRVARFLVDRGQTPREDYASQALREIPFTRWREYEPEDTVRFYALRLHEAGMIKGTPQKILAQGADWRFLNEVKKELKG